MSQVVVEEQRSEFARPSRQVTASPKPREEGQHV